MGFDARQRDRDRQGLNLIPNGRGDAATSSQPNLRRWPRCFARRTRLTDGPTKLRIIAVPPGEAPLWVREKWVGLKLPVAQHNSRNFLTSGVLSAPRTLFGRLLMAIGGRLQTVSGYAVESVSAIAILERTSPEAAAWWRENVGHRIKPGQRFVFHAEVCQISSQT